MSSLQKILDGIRSRQQSDLRVSHLEPDVDERNIPDGAQLREHEALEGGGVMKAVIEESTKGPSPKSGDVVFLRYTIRNRLEEIIESTEEIHGGPGHSRPFLLNEGASRPLRGIELAVADMGKGERSLLEIKPEMAYMHPECHIKIPQGLRENEMVKVDLTLVDWLPGSGHSASIGADGIAKLVLEEGKGWETPRHPFEIHVDIIARAIDEDARLQKGRPLYEVKDLSCKIGSGILAAGLESAICQMRRGETSIVWCPVHLETPVDKPHGETTLNDSGKAEDGAACEPLSLPSSFTSSSIPFHRLRYVEYTVTLNDFTQVRDIMGDGAVMKFIIHKGEGVFPADCPLEDTEVAARIRVRSIPDAGSSVPDSLAEWQDVPPYPGPGILDSDSDVHDTKAIRFETGMGVVPAPIDASIRVMLRGEIARVTSDWDHVFARTEWGEDPMDSYKLDLSHGSNVEFEIELLDFVPALTPGVGTGNEKINSSVHLREQGNMLFKARRYNLAKMKYMKALRCVEKFLDAENEDQVVASTRSKIACLLNLAACAQKLDEWGETIAWCDKVLR